MIMRRFRAIRQRDAMQCGVAALWMVVRHFGAEVPLERLEKLYVPTAEGVSMKGISDAAKALGMVCAGVRTSPERLPRLPLPCILHWNQEHFTVLYRVSRNGQKFYVADPAKGKTVYGREAFCRHWVQTRSAGKEKGIALFFDPEAPPDPQKVAALTSGAVRPRTVPFLLKYIRQYRSFFVQIALGLILASLLQLVMPFLTQAIVDTGIRHKDVGFIWLILLGELMIMAGRTVTEFIRRWLLLHISMRVNISLVSDFLVKLLRLPMSFFDTKQTGDLLQRMADHDRIQSFLTSQTLGVVFSVINFVVFGVVLFIYDPTVFAIFAGGTALYSLWTVSFMRRRKVIDYELFEAQAENSNRTYRFITSMQEIKLQGCGTRRRWEWEDAQASLFEIRMKSLKLQQAQEAGSIFINEVKNIFITVLAATAVIRGDLTLGGMLAIQYIVGQLNSPVNQLMAFVLALQDVRISLERINEVHGGRDEEPDNGRIATFAAGERKGISIKDVTFKYDMHSPVEALSGVTIDIPAGKVTAVVGASGSGKTTLIKLLLGYYPALSGEITIEGEPLDSYSMRWWRSRCGAVMQEGVIFSDSIARNIAVEDIAEGEEPDMELVKESARMACIAEWIEGLPLGYDTRVGQDGVGLSQGQRQRLLIARAIYRRPDYIFLDEATNSLDAANERNITRNLAEFYKGRTVVIVAHRLSTVRDADNIIVLDGGRVAESGTHESLLARKGKYWNLIRNQLELGQ